MKTKILALAMGLMLFCQVALAGPKLKLSASRMSDNGNGITVALNERVSVQIDAESGSSIAIFCIPKTTYITRPDNREVTFYAVKNVQFMIAAFKDGTVTKQTLLVTVGGDPVPPGPEPPGPTPPGPGPEPKPVPTSTIGKTAYSAAMKVNAAHRASDAAAMAKHFRAIHAKAVAVSTMKWSEIIGDSMKGSVSKIPAANQKAWAPWGIEILKLMATEITGSDANKRKLAIKAVEEIAKGLEAVK